MFLSLYSIESNIQEKLIRAKYHDYSELDKLFLDFVSDITLLYRKKLKVIKLEELVEESKKEPKSLFDIWMPGKEYIERARSWERVINYLGQNGFIRIDGQTFFWEYAEGRKRNPFLASLLYVLKSKNYITIEDRKGALYMSILSRTFNISLKTPADFSLNNINSWNSSKEAELFSGMP